MVEAEETGLIVPIGEWVLVTACAQIKTWQKENLPRIRVAINLSSRQFQQRNLFKVIEGALNKTGLEPKYLELELTESIFLQRIESTIATLQKLHEMGIAISIDDFGTGYSSLNYLKRFPISILKIDRVFVNDITSNPDDAAIASAIITMAHSLKLEVVAEGVETEEQLQFLRTNHCDKMQGYLFSKPLPADELAQLLLKKQPPPIGRHPKSLSRPGQSPIK